MNIVKFNAVQEKIIKISGKHVILDSDVAELYDVETMRINEAVKNNPKKFPKGYVIELTKKEKQEVIENFDNLKVKFSPVVPKAFTRKGLYMLATILKGDKAAETTVAIIEAFDKIMELQETVAELSNSSDKFQQKTLMQKGGEIISEIIGSNLETSESETTFEIDFALMKFKHTIKRNKK
ncbi:MAG: ORF6N domain-containing protein [Marinilabiliaceae bacterium]|nr:ORF6N domain-containing protein [Marinilabiliaceae bacterium]